MPISIILRKYYSLNGLCYKNIGNLYIFNMRTKKVKSKFFIYQHATFQRFIHVYEAFFNIQPAKVICAHLTSMYVFMYVVRAVCYNRSSSLKNKRFIYFMTNKYCKKATHCTGWHSFLWCYTFWDFYNAHNWP